MRLGEGPLAGAAVGLQCTAARIACAPHVHSLAATSDCTACSIALAADKGPQGCCSCESRGAIAHLKRSPASSATSFPASMAATTCAGEVKVGRNTLVPRAQSPGVGASLRNALIVAQPNSEVQSEA